LRFLARFALTFNPPTILKQPDHPMRCPVAFDLPLRLRNSVCDQISLIFSHFSLTFLILPVRLPINGCLRHSATSRDSPRSERPIIRSKRHSPIFVCNFAFAAYVRSVVPASSLSVRQERAFNKTLCTSECGGRISWSCESLGCRTHSESFWNPRIQNAEARDTHSRAFLEQKILLVVIDRLFYGLVSKGHMKWICSCAFMRNR
jgi:hypothetical protein